MSRVYFTTAIPYVNGAPHLGHALEFVQADVLARHRRQRGDEVRLQSGTDDHALKNVLAARNAGLSTPEFVNIAASRFEDLQSLLQLTCDDFVRTSSDPRHRAGVEHLWRRCASAGDFYRRRYAGLYCVGCEQFYDEDQLLAGRRCPEHRSAVEEVSETNWFFRLNRYATTIRAAITSGELKINPPQKRNEVLALLDRGLRDFSVSRPADRADGWGIPVPDDPDQVVYVWWDALTNYVTTLGIANHGPEHQRWWHDSNERVQVIGKGITRFHAVYWIALLLSAREPLPTTIHVHDYVTADGEKLSKSSGTVVDPVQLITLYGVDALRWWLTREVPLLGDTEFTEHRLIAAHDTDLANGLGNLASRTTTLLARHFDGRLTVCDSDETDSLDRSIAALPTKIDVALETADFRTATAHLVAAVDEANRLLNRTAVWHAVQDPPRRDTAHALLSTVVRHCRTIATELTPFCPSGAERLTAVLGTGPGIGAPQRVFGRLAR